MIAEARREPDRFTDVDITVSAVEEERALVAYRWLDRATDGPADERRLYQVVSLRSGRIADIRDYENEGDARAELARPAPPPPPRQRALGSRVVPSLHARDLRDTIAFYKSKLGFRVTGLYPDDEPVWCELRRGDIRLMFSRLPDAEEPTLTGALYLWPEDVKALHAELVERGVVVERGPEVMEYGMREFAVRDPNGYLLEFGEPA